MGVDAVEMRVEEKSVVRNSIVDAAMVTGCSLWCKDAVDSSNSPVAKGS